MAGFIKCYIPSKNKGIRQQLFIGMFRKKKNGVEFKEYQWVSRHLSMIALRSGDTIASEVLTEAWLLLIEN